MHIHAWGGETCWMGKKKRFKACLVSGEMKQIPEGGREKKAQLVLNN